DWVSGEKLRVEVSERCEGGPYEPIATGRRADQIRTRLHDMAPGPDPGARVVSAASRRRQPYRLAGRPPGVCRVQPCAMRYSRSAAARHRAHFGDARDSLRAGLRAGP